MSSGQSMFQSQNPRVDLRDTADGVWGSMATVEVKVSLLTRAERSIDRTCVTVPLGGAVRGYHTRFRP